MRGMSDIFDTNPAFVLSRPEHERRALYESLVQADAVDKLILWFSDRNRILTRDEARALLPITISMSYNP